jgi:hypothetical protein
MLGKHPQQENQGGYLETRYIVYRLDILAEYTVVVTYFPESLIAAFRARNIEAFELPLMMVSQAV